MSTLGSEIALVADVLPERVKSALDHLERAWIETAIEATGTASVRERRLPAPQVVWMVIGISMMRSRSIIDVVDKLSIALPSAKSVAPSAVTQARQRLGPEPIEWLFRHSAQAWARERQESELWRGLRVFGVDGTKFGVPDSLANNERFHKHTGGNGTGAFPLARVVAVVALGSRICCDAAIGSFAKSELELAAPLWERIEDNSLTIVDRGFFYSTALVELAAKGTNRHWLTRARKNTRMRVVQELGPGDQLVEVNVDSDVRRARPDLPKTWTMRAIHWRDDRAGSPMYLMTSLLDPDAHPAAELRHLYVERWEQEYAFDDLKTSQLAAEHVLRSRTPDCIEQEIWGTLLAYNLIRVEMAAIARAAKVTPNRVSFIQALRLITDEWLWLADTRSPGAIPKHLARLRENLVRLILPERRKRPTQPRAVKSRPRKYPSKGSATN